MVLGNPQKQTEAKMKKVQMKQPFVAAVLALMLGACDGALPAMDGDDADKGTTANGSSSKGSVATIGVDVPEDSTGKEGSANLSISGATSGLSLADSSIAVDASTSIDTARIAIRNVKIKTSTEHSAEEKALKEELKRTALEEKIENRAVERKLEQQKKDAEKDYEIAKESAKTDAQKLAAKQQFKAALRAIEVEKAASEAEFEAAKAAREAAKDKNVRWGGPFMFDAVAGTLDQPFPAIDLTDGSYRRIEFKLHVARDLEADDPMLNKSVLITGRVTKAGVEVPFEVSCSGSEELRLTAKTGLKIAGGVSNNLMLVLDAASWLKGVDLATATVATDGVIRVNESENKLLYKLFRFNMRSMTRFGKDDDSNGKIASSEASGDGSESVAELEEESDSDEVEEEKAEKSADDDADGENESEDEDESEND